MMDSATLVKQLRYQGRQYSNGMAARGGAVREQHYLTQSANLIDGLELRIKDAEAIYAGVVEGGSHSTVPITQSESELLRALNQINNVLTRGQS